MSFFVQMGVIFVYVALVVGSLVLLVTLRRKYRYGKFPVPKDVRLRRRAGEALSRDIERLWEKFFTDLILRLAVPPTVVIPIVLLMQFLPKQTSYVITGLAACLIVFVAATWYVVRLLLRRVDEINNKNLGLYGERLTGDHLMPLMAHGYDVFHDVPCLGGGGSFNLDHVVVGQGEVIVVETKTYRKPREVAENHKVSYDGTRLKWPHRTSTEELEQVLDGARWLRGELRKKLGFDVPVRAALTIPGWYVTGGPPQAPVLVENIKRLPHFIRQRFSGSLKSDHEQQVRLHLRSMTETVEFGSQ